MSAGKRYEEFRKAWAFLFGLVPLVCCCTLVPPASAQDDGTASPLMKFQAPEPAYAEGKVPFTPPESSPAQGTAANETPFNPVTQAALNAGVRSCADRLNQVTAFLTGNSLSGALLFRPSPQPDQHIFSVSLEVQGKDLPPIYASASVAPNEGGCDALYEAVTYWDTSCDNLARTRLANKKATGVLKSSIAVLESGPNVRIFLLPAGKGCVSIKKAVLN